jgi:hypothetical protein
VPFGAFAVELISVPRINQREAHGGELAGIGLPHRTLVRCR